MKNDSIRFEYSIHILFHPIALYLGTHLRGQIRRVPIPPWAGDSGR